MSLNKDYYEILGLKKGASDKDIKSAYRKMAAKWHPDKFATASEEEKKEAEEKFKEINEANAILSDPEKKSNYDQFGDPDGAMEQDFDPFGGFNPFGGFGSRGNQIEKGEDIEAKVYITTKEAYEGCTVDVKYNRLRKCVHCNGTGSDDGKVHECPYCHGTGRIRQQVQRGNMTMINETYCYHCNGTGKDKSVKECKHCGGTGFETENSVETITLPAGVETGMGLKIQGKGSEPLHKGINGNLYIIVIVKDDTEYKKEGDDLIKKLELNLDEAWNGTEKLINCIDGTTVKIKIPELTECNKRFRIKGKGWKNLNGYTGDLIVEVKYIVPKKMTNKQKELIKEFYKQ